MTEVPITLPSTVEFTLDPTRAGEVICDCARQFGLEIRLETTLASRPGSRHWHFRLPKSPGTLEATVEGNRAWFSYRAGRDAAWVGAAATELAERVGDALAGPQV